MDDISQSPMSAISMQFTERSNVKLPPLSNLNRPVDNYANILINRLVTRLDSNTKRDWELQLATSTTASHKVQDCASKCTCHDCKMKHHTLLHRDNTKQIKNSSVQTPDKESPWTSSQVETKNVQSHFSTSETLKEKRVMLATVKLCVLSNSNQKIQLVALLDQGSSWRN